MVDTIGFPRWTQDVTWSGGSWQADYPVSNLGIPPFARVARSTNTTNTQFRGDFSRARTVQIVALCRHNLTLDATWRVKLFEKAADVQPVYDSGDLAVWPKVYDPDEVAWDAGNFWDRQYTEAELAGYPWHTPLFIDGQIAAEAFTVAITDPDNLDGFVEVGLCEVASALDLPIGFAFGAQMGFTSRTTVTEADGGVEYYEPKQKPRTYTGSLTAVARSTSLTQFFELQRQHDINVPFFWWPDRTNVKDTLRIAFMARLQQLDKLTQAFTAHDGITLSIKEIL